METNAVISDELTSGTPAVSALERRVDLSLSIADFEKDVDQRLKRLSRNMKMPGFRPGKVPANIARLQYGQQARQEALTEALAQLFSAAVTAQKLRVAGVPKIEAKNSDNPTHLEFSAIFEVYPEIVLRDLEGVEIERPVLVVGPTEIDRTIEILRKQRVRYEPVDRAAAKADQVSIDFLGKRDGQPFAGGQGKDYRFVLGEGKMLSDFESAVIGTRPGEAKSFDMTFPAEYFSKELAGQSVTFDISVKEVGEPVLPEVDADFARALGVEDGDLVKMRAEIEDNLKRESEHLMQSTRQNMERRGLKVNEMPMQPEWFADQARQRVGLGLILSEIVKQYGLEARPQQVRAMVEEVAQSYEHPEEVVRWHYAQPERLADFEAAAIEANVVDWALAKVMVVDKPIAFAELMGQQS